ncbi:MAG: hypothetical protein P8X74_16120 [Reinekea sp.]
MGAPAIFEEQIQIKLLHSASTEGVTDSGLTRRKSCLHVRLKDHFHCTFGSPFWKKCYLSHQPLLKHLAWRKPCCSN